MASALSSALSVTNLMAIADGSSANERSRAVKPGAGFASCPQHVWCTWQKETKRAEKQESGADRSTDKMAHGARADEAAHIAGETTRALQLLEAARRATACGELEHAQILSDGTLETLEPVRKALRAMISDSPKREANAPAEADVKVTPRQELERNTALAALRSLDTIFAAVSCLQGNLVLLKHAAPLQGAETTAQVQAPELYEPALFKFRAVWAMCKSAGEDEDNEVRLDPREAPHLEFEAVVGIGTIMMRTGAHALAETSFIGALATAKGRNDLQEMSAASLLVATACLRFDPIKKERCSEYMEKARMYAREHVQHMTGLESENAAAFSVIMLDAAKLWMCNTSCELADMYSSSLHDLEAARSCLEEAREIASSEEKQHDIDARLQALEQRATAQ
ncbi:hypothetical protein FVE85_4540 [Porphyridium purpureum]|uniref:Uncharacterized protein n=1 Tax=Porphyridium purpureum TaxID=35688 RepID=A0A5J4YKD1_PORPP|nr:hypothetical protein FVE85_4540 [Porphyridium purpureum]|eukprot:POR2908..scf297_16